MISKGLLYLKKPVKSANVCNQTLKGPLETIPTSFPLLALTYCSRVGQQHCHTRFHSELI